MRRGPRLLVVSFIIALPLSIPMGSFAQSEPDVQASQPTSADRFHADAEVDPTAYVLEGFSIHVGLGWQRWRLDLGNFAIAIPQFVHGNSDYAVSFDGYGAKLQYFLFAEQSGAFVGIDGGANKLYLERKGTDLARRQTQYGLGAHAGWRFPIAAGLYLTAWAGVSYTFNARDVTLAGSTFESKPLTPFAAIHVGYRFR